RTVSTAMIAAAMASTATTIGIIRGPGRSGGARGSTSSRSLRLGTVVGEEDHVPQRGGGEHALREPVDADADAALGRHAVLEGTEEVLVQGVGLLVAGLAGGHLRLELGALLVGGG